MLEIKDYREIKVIAEALKALKEPIWMDLAKRIKKGTPLEKIKEYRKEFDEMMNPFRTEGLCNRVLKKIDELDERLLKEIGGDKE
jgi:hypothetical protein